MSTSSSKNSILSNEPEEDKSETLVNVIVQHAPAYMEDQYIKLKGLQAGGMYEDQVIGKVYSAEALMEIGLKLPYITEEHTAFQVYLKMI